MFYHIKSIKLLNTSILVYTFIYMGFNITKKDLKIKNQKLKPGVKNATSDLCDNAVAIDYILMVQAR